MYMICVALPLSVCLEPMEPENTERIIWLNYFRQKTIETGFKDPL